MLQLAFLGTGSSSSTEKNPSSFAISCSSRLVMIDFGGGAYHQLSRLNNSSFAGELISDIFLTHFHMDHVSGLPDFLWGEIWNNRGQRTNPVNIIGPRGLKEFWCNRLIPFFDREIPYTVNLHELDENDLFEDTLFSVKSVKLQHNENSTSYLFSFDGINIAFTGDTGYCPELIDLVNSADLAVCEWSFTENSPSDSHLGGDEIEMLLENTDPRCGIYFTHIFPEINKNFSDLIKRREERTDPYNRNLYFPEDLFILDVKRKA